MPVIQHIKSLITLANTVIIAEAGVNHNGDLILAKKLVDAAAEAGADYVKFQTFKAEKLVAKNAPKAAYQKVNIKDGDDTQFAMLKKLELKEEWHQELIDYCAGKNIKFLSTGFDNDSLEFLHSLGIQLAKVPSGEITNLPYLKKVAVLFPEIIMSTGMADIEEIREALNVLLQNGAQREKITILHCNTEYPTPMKDVNLKAMLHIQKEFNIAVGYSDHTIGIEVPVAAVALGACVIEKHFTISRNMEGPDHKASLEPAELKSMILAIKNIEIALGDGIKKPSLSEQKNKAVARKSIVAAKSLSVGHIIQQDDLAIKRPGNGIPPMLMDTVIGKQLKKAIKEDELLTYEYFV